MNIGPPPTRFVACLHPFDFREFDQKTKALERVSEEKALEIGRQISPITHVSSDDPPTLMIHGDADKLVPIQQAQSIAQRLTEAGVTAEVVVKPGLSHGWPDLPADITTIADWFDTYLVSAK